MLPSERTDSTTPMCSSHTMRSPGFGSWPDDAGTARPDFCAQAYRASTEPKPWPWSPTGTPAPRASHEVKYAHHGPGPGAPAVALRYWAMRGELLEPGGCSAWPTSACAIATMRAAGELPGGAAAGEGVPGAAVPVAMGARGGGGPGAEGGRRTRAGAPVTEAVRSICAKSSLDGVAVVVVVAGAVVAGAVGPTSSVLSCAIRAMAVSRLIPLPTSVLRAGALTPALGDNVA